jgi:CheY-like chemotaxis protein
MSAYTPPEVQPVVVHIDDDQDLIDLTRLALQPLAVRFVGIVRSHAGLETVRFVRPALVLLDLMMPEMDGWELLRAIRADPMLKETKVVLYTALTGERDKARGRASGIDEYLTKPCQPSRLRGIIARLTGVPDTPPGPRSSRGAPAAPPAPDAPPAQASTGEQPARPLPATADGAVLPAVVVDFVDRYLDNTVALEVVTYLNDNPGLYLSTQALARALGRKPPEVEPSLQALVERGLLLGYADEHGDSVYMLNSAGPAKQDLEGFFQACADPLVRIKALYRIIRRRTAWQ